MFYCIFTLLNLQMTIYNTFELEWQQFLLKFFIDVFMKCDVTYYSDGSCSIRTIRSLRQSLYELDEKIKEQHKKKYCHNNTSLNVKLIPLEFILKRPFALWNYSKICVDYPTITEEILLKNSLVPWDYYVLTEHPNISLEFKMQHLNYPWNLRILFDDNVDEIMKTIDAYPNVKWNFEDLSNIANLPIKFIMRYPYSKWNYNVISSLNQTITEEIIDLNPTFPWMNHKLIYNSKISIEYIIANIKVKWQCPDLLNRGDITIETIFNNPFFGWEYANLSLYFPFFKWNMILENLRNGYIYQMPIIMDNTIDTININLQIGIPLNFERISESCELSIYDILNNPRLPWTYGLLSANVNIPIEQLLKNPQLYWNASNLLKRPDITFKHVYDLLEENMFGFNFDSLCDNKFIIEKEKFFRMKSIVNFLHIAQEIGK